LRRAAKAHEPELKAVNFTMRDAPDLLRPMPEKANEQDTYESHKTNGATREQDPAQNLLRASAGKGITP